MTAAADAKALAREEQGRRRAALIKGKKKLQATLSSHLSAVGSLFQMWDLNGNGVLDQDEFCQAVNALSVREVPQEVAAMLFRDFDKDRSGEISYHEFLRYALRDALAKSSTKVMDMFQSMDKDGGGEIDVDEFRRGLGSLGFDVPYEAAGEVFDAMDSDGSGKISFDELHKQLRVGATIELSKRLKAGGAGQVKTSQADKQQKHKLRGTWEEQYMRELNAANEERVELKRQRALRMQVEAGGGGGGGSVSIAGFESETMGGGGAESHGRTRASKPSGPPPDHLMQLMGADSFGLPRGSTAPTMMMQLGGGGLSSSSDLGARPATAGPGGGGFTHGRLTATNLSLASEEHGEAGGSGMGGGSLRPLSPSSSSQMQQPRGAPPPRPGTSPGALRQHMGMMAPGAGDVRRGMSLSQSHQRGHLTYEEQAAARGVLGRGGTLAVGNAARLADGNESSYYSGGMFAPNLKLTPALASASEAVYYASRSLPGGRALRASRTAQPGGGGTVALPEQVQRAAAMRRGGMPISAGVFVIGDEKKSRTIQQEKREAAKRRNDDFALEQSGRQLRRPPEHPMDPRYSPEYAAHYEAKKLGGTFGGSTFASGVLTSGSANGTSPPLRRPYSKSRAANARSPVTLAARGDGGPPGYTLGYPSQHTESFMGGAVSGIEADDVLVYQRKTQPGVFHTHKWAEPVPDTTPRGTQMLMTATGCPPKPNYALPRSVAYPRRYTSSTR